ncbi:hypothetical protein ABIA33_007360 [Streptacidiphilus sp. MAP12-16]|uniref:hypothetical protein n=1 Tax=Streptacidiphilus sp. MAP12-16 TaxID=3156300 RepID=UPI003517369B
MKKLRLAASAAALAMAAATSLVTADSASAANVVTACRTPDLAADGLYVHTCINTPQYDGHHVWATVSTYGGNNTSINLCVEVLDTNQNVVPGSLACKVVWGPSGSVASPTVTVGDGFVNAQSFFTSPTYWYGGMSAAICNVC